MTTKSISSRANRMRPRLFWGLVAAVWALMQVRYSRSTFRLSFDVGA